MTPDEGLFEIGIKLFVKRGEEFLVLIANNTKKGDFPGGRIGLKDSLFKQEESMRREILEELGDKIKLRVSREPVFTFPYTSKQATQEVLGLAHLAEYVEGEFSLSDEHERFFWCTPEQALPYFESEFLEGLKIFVERYQSLSLGANPIEIG